MPDLLYGLGAIQSPSDARDWPLQLAPAEGALPSRFVATGMGPVLNQGKLPQCVAYATAGLKTWEEKKDAHGVVTWDTRDFYQRCKAIDDIPGDGTTNRAAMRVLRNAGMRPIGEPEADPAHYRIAAYYAVPLDLDSLKAALMQYGPITVGGEWYNNWFHPIGGILPAPKGRPVGGHAVLVFGWDDSVNGGSLLVRNSWGYYVGSVNGNFYGAYRHFIPSLWEAWKATDIVSHPR